MITKTEKQAILRAASTTLGLAATRVPGTPESVFRFASFLRDSAGKDPDALLASGILEPYDVREAVTAFAYSGERPIHERARAWMSEPSKSRRGKRRTSRRKRR